MKRAQVNSFLFIDLHTSALLKVIRHRTLNSFGPRYLHALIKLSHDESIIMQRYIGYEVIKLNIRDAIFMRQCIHSTVQSKRSVNPNILETYILDIYLKNL